MRVCIFAIFSNYTNEGDKKAARAFREKTCTTKMLYQMQFQSLHRRSSNNKRNTMKKSSISLEYEPDLLENMILLVVHYVTCKPERRATIQMSLANKYLKRF
uniref:Uncharacterized protein n=1 Tax=Glossina austeni TaxID=7395 RepID=A0A1A9VYI7_GLOAU